MSDLDADLDERIESLVDWVRTSKLGTNRGEVSKMYIETVNGFIDDNGIQDAETKAMIKREAGRKFKEKTAEADNVTESTLTETKEASDQTVAEFDHQVKALAGIVRKLKINGQMSGGTIALIRTATTDLEKIVRRLK